MNQSNDLNQFNNLPAQLPFFVGREDELKRSKELLLKKRVPVLLLWGEAGAGKTSLAIELAYQILQANVYDAIIWTTAKTIELGVAGSLFRRGHVRRVNRTHEGAVVESLSDLYQTILVFSGYPDYQMEEICEDENRLGREVFSWLEQQRILVIIDDLDSWQKGDWRYLRRFVEKVNYPSSIIITTRRKLTSDDIDGIAAIHVGPFSMQDARQLLGKSLRKQELDINKADLEDILRFADGNPLILVMIVGLIRLRSQFLFWGTRKTTSDVVAEILDYVRQEVNVSEFLFEDLFQTLTKRSQKVLQSIAALKTISYDISEENIAEISGVKDDDLQKSLEELQTASLVNRTPEDNDQFDLHPLTLQFALRKDPARAQNLINKAQLVLLKPGLDSSV